MLYFNHVRSCRSWRFGITHDLVTDNGQVYLERWIIWCGITLRLHKFHKGDDDRAFHDHPWWFITLPLQTYEERTPTQSAALVRRWRPHFRPAAHRHIVQLRDNKPIWTLIITGSKSQDWGFWDKDKFIHHEQWLSHRESIIGAVDT